MDSLGNLFIADQVNYRIRRVDTATGIITTIAGNSDGGFSGDGGPATSASLAYPRDVIVDSGGNLFISEGNNKRIRKVDAETGIIITIEGNGNYGFSGDGGPATSAEFREPSGMAVDGRTGDLFIADRFNNRIRMVEGVASIPPTPTSTPSPTPTPMSTATPTPTPTPHAELSVTKTDSPHWV